jgi:hypothetical protein
LMQLKNLNRLTDDARAEIASQANLIKNSD